MFIENVGQFPAPAGGTGDERARFQVRGSMGIMWLAEDAIWITVLETPPRPSPTSGREHIPPLTGGLRGDVDGGIEGSEPRRGVHLKLTFPGANPHSRIEPFDRLDTVVSYFIGNDPAKWRPGVPVWGGVRYVGLYPSIDLELTSENGYLVQRLVAQPGADLSMVRLCVEGTDALALGSDRLHLTTAVGDFTLPLRQAMAPDGTSTPKYAQYAAGAWTTGEPPTNAGDPDTPEKEGRLPVRSRPWRPAGN